MGITGVAQAEYGVLKLLEFRRFPATQEFNESDGVIGRIALALSADDHRQQPFFGEFTQRVGIGSQQADSKTLGLCFACQCFGLAFGVTGLAAIHDTQALNGWNLVRDGMQGVSAGVVLSVLSGLCYGVTGVFIRKAVRSQMPVEATLFLFSAVGFLVLCPLSLLLMPIRSIADTSPMEWMTIVVAGVFNALGFFAITHAMRQMTISRANVINASQNAMCAIGAVLVFGESLAIPGLIGIGLTIAGLLVLDRR